MRIRRSIHCGLALIVCAVLCSCGATLDTRAGHAISERAYNDAIERNEYDVYCADGRCDEPPKFLGGDAPIYPADLQRQGVTGSVTMTFVLAADGIPRDITVVSATRQEFADAALTAVRSWRYRPARLKGQVVEMTFNQTIPFTF